jgi:hypothetical protein
MNKLGLGALGAVGAMAALLFGLEKTAIAADHYCYFEDASGVLHDLGDICGGTETPTPFPALPLTTPQDAPILEQDYRAYLEAEGLRLFTQGNYTGRDRIDLAYEVWTINGGGGFYYFLKGEAVRVNGDPDRIVYFSDNVAFANDESVYACYYQTGACEGERSWSRWQYTCLVPWQVVGGRLCGTAAPIQDFSSP